GSWRVAMRSAGGRVLDGGDPGLRRVPRRDGGEADPEGERLEPGLLLGAEGTEPLIALAQRPTGGEGRRAPVAEQGPEQHARLRELRDPVIGADLVEVEHGGDLSVAQEEVRGAHVPVDELREIYEVRQGLDEGGEPGRRGRGPVVVAAAQPGEHPLTQRARRWPVEGRDVEPTEGVVQPGEAGAD